MEAYISTILISIFWIVILCLSWRHSIARHITLIGAWSQICLTIAETYYPQFLQIAIYSILIIWALVVILAHWGFSKVVLSDNKVLHTLFYSAAILVFVYLLSINIISVPKFYQLGVLMTALTYIVLSLIAAVNKVVFNNRFYISSFTVGLAFLVGNTLHLMIEWTALVFFFDKILYVVAFLLFLLGILGYILMYQKKTSIINFVSTYAFGFLMGYYGYNIIILMQRLYM